MRKIFFIFILLLLFSCNPFYKQYQNLNVDLQKNKSYSEQLLLIKPLLLKEKEPFILAISWDKNILTKDGKLHYDAVIYNAQSGEKKMFSTTENSEMIVQSKDNSDIKFRELIYILENYINGKEEYLLSLHDSFSSSEMNKPYYIYDFVKKKKLKVKTFFFDKEGKIIQ
ncbi:hypothetical protein [Chryseobacterium sp. W4I1]|uniref:hypothetical protein n=1 Tax=Chryseobacterium sp. W4I1 TaxID=3042293 RepID=UPI002784AE85|nr:hypothetical protein [Chryseobacterium sp. W4I1]MDQ0780371.1 hypothetical protein [Chryseobacterium sp. W4I1]